MKKQQMVKCPNCAFPIFLEDIPGSDMAARIAELEAVNRELLAVLKRIAKEELCCNHSTNKPTDFTPAGIADNCIVCIANELIARGGKQ